MASTDTGAPIIGWATSDSCEGIDLLTMEVNDGNGVVIDAYLDEAALFRTVTRRRPHGRRITKHLEKPEVLVTTLTIVGCAAISVIGFLLARARLDPSVRARRRAVPLSLYALSAAFLAGSLLAAEPTVGHRLAALGFAAVGLFVVRALRTPHRGRPDVA